MTLSGVQQGHDEGHDGALSGPVPRSTFPWMAHSFPGYRVIQQLYASARSVVVRAVCAADGQTVVIKQSSGELVAAEAARRVQHEYDLLCALRGVGIIEVREVIRDSSHVALVLES